MVAADPKVASHEAARRMKARSLSRDARDLAIHVEALKRHVERHDRPLAVHARRAWLELRELADSLSGG